MRRGLFILVLVVCTLGWASTATADCWRCGVDDCCEDAPSNSSGRSACSYSLLCGSGGCLCYGCTTSGGTCAGSGPAECTNPNGICEENQTLNLTPHGDAVPMETLRDPAVLSMDSQQDLCSNRPLA